MKQTIDFTRKGGFPFAQETLDFMQGGYRSILQTLTDYMGVPGEGGHIISGVRESDGMLTAGWVAIDGEVLPFVKSAKGNAPKIAVRERRRAVDFYNEPDQDVYIERWAEASQTEGTPLADFGRIKQPADLLPRDGGLPMTGELDLGGHPLRFTSKAQGAANWDGIKFDDGNAQGTSPGTFHFMADLDAGAAVGNAKLAAGAVGIGTVPTIDGIHFYGDRYGLYGPNSSWGQYLQVGGNGRTENRASVVATNGNLHLDAKDGYKVSLNNYGKGHTVMNISGGNVGVGTSAPESVLHVKRDSATAIIENTKGNDWARLRIKGSGGNFWDIGQYGDAKQLEFRPWGGSTGAVAFHRDGKVGIGTRNPRARLHVNYPDDVGKGQDPAFLIGDRDGHHLAIDNNEIAAFSKDENSVLYINTSGSQANTLMNTDGGKVGVGTNDPKQKLHVNGGNIRVQSSHGYADMGSLNSSWFHFQTDRPHFHFNKRVDVNGNLGLYNKSTYMRYSDGSIVEHGARLSDRYLGKDAKAADSDKLDGLDSNDFARQQTIPEKTLNVGWYTIAVNKGDRASAKFVLRDIRSGYHQMVHFYAAHHFGNGNVITVLSNSRHANGGVFRYLRIKEGGTYDGALLQVYVDADTSPVLGRILENHQSSGWAPKDWVPDGTDPGGVKNFAALANVPALVDLDKTQGIQSTQEMYVNGHRVYNQGYMPAASEIGALPRDGSLPMTGPLHVKRNRASATIENTDANNWAFLRIKGSGSNFWDIAQYGDNGLLEFRPKGSGTGAVKIDKNGNIAYPGKLNKLDVDERFSAYVRAADFNLGHKDRKGGTGRALVDGKTTLCLNYASDWDLTSIGGDKVGVGTGSPAQKLHVNGGYVRVQSSHGYADIGPMNTSWFHFQTDRPAFYFNKRVDAHGNLGLYNKSTYMRYSDGSIISAGNIYANGSYYYGDNDRVIGFYDNWLRLNPGRDFTSGIFCDTSVLRTDGEFQVGSSGSSFKANSSGAWVKGRPVTTYLHRGRKHLGNPNTDHRYYVDIPDVGTSNYAVLGNLQCQDSDWNRNNDVFFVIGFKDRSYFYLLLREFAGGTQNLYFDYVLVAL